MIVLIYVLICTKIIVSGNLQVLNGQICYKRLAYEDVLSVYNSRAKMHRCVYGHRSALYLYLSIESYSWNCISQYSTFLEKKFDKRMYDLALKPDCQKSLLSYRHVTCLYQDYHTNPIPSIFILKHVLQQRWPTSIYFNRLANDGTVLVVVLP